MIETLKSASLGELLNISKEDEMRMKRNIKFYYYLVGSRIWILGWSRTR